MVNECLSSIITVSSDCWWLLLTTSGSAILSSIPAWRAKCNLTISNNQQYRRLPDFIPCSLWHTGGHLLGDGFDDRCECGLCPAERLRLMVVGMVAGLQIMTFWCPVCLLGLMIENDEWCTFIWWILVDSGWFGWWLVTLRKLSFGWLRLTLLEERKCSESCLREYRQTIDDGW